MGEKCVLSEFGLSKLHLIENQKVVFSLYIMFIYVIYNNTQRASLRIIIFRTLQCYPQQSC